MTSEFLPHECAYPNKRRFLTELDALRGVARIKSREVAAGRKFDPLYPYRCPGNGHWHLSSARQASAACASCGATRPAWFDKHQQRWTVYQHGDCPTGPTHEKKESQ